MTIHPTIDLTIDLTIDRIIDLTIDLTRHHKTPGDTAPLGNTGHRGTPRHATAHHRDTTAGHPWPPLDNPG
eukprot:2926774-Pyramimonas_sp.AAC.1